MVQVCLPASRVASLALLALLICGPLASGPARAADLGGDCCADLEARVAELEATAVRKGNRKLSLTISGRLDTNIMVWTENSTGPSSDNGPFDRTRGVYFGNSATDNRDPNIVFSGSGKIAPGVTAGFSMQIDNRFAGSDTQISNQASTVITSDTIYVFLRSSALGELRLGSMYAASDDAYYLNFGGGTVGGVSGANHTGSFRLRDTAGALTDTTYYSVLGEMSDFAESRLMYVSPTFAGLTVKADIGQSTASASITSIAKLGSIEFEEGVGYQQANGMDGDCAGNGLQCTQSFDALSAANPWTNATHTDLRAIGLSASIWDTASGFYVSGQYSKVYADLVGRDDPVNWFAQAGWAKNAGGFGQTTIYASYDRTTGKAANAVTAHYWNAGIDQAIDAVSSNIYLHYQHDSLDSSGVITGGGATVTSSGGAIDAQSIDSVTGGMVVHF